MAYEKLREEIRTIAEWLRANKGKVPQEQWLDRQKLAVDKLRELSKVGDLPAFVDDKPAGKVPLIKPARYHAYSFYKRR